MIASIELQNFQSHARTRVNLGDFTAIVGRSSSGKTSILRALEWVFYGEWDDTYPMDPEKPTAAAVELRNGTKIVRMRHDDENRATVIIPGQEPLKFKDFGYIIPGIFDIINLRPIQSGKQKINLNFSKQDEPLFMLSDAFSKPARAQWLGRLYGAHLLNSMLRLMAKDKKDAEASVKTLEADQADLRLQLDRYDTLDAQEAAIGAARAIHGELTTLSGLRADAEALKARAERVRSQRWLLDVDTSLLRSQVDRLARLQEVRERLSKAVRTAEALRARKPLLEADLPAMRRDVDTLTRLSAIKEEGRVVADLEARLAAKAPIMQADLPAMRRQAEELRSLLELREAAARVARLEAALAAKAPAAGADTAGMRSALAQLELLRGIKADIQAFSPRANVAKARLAEVTKRLAKANAELSAALFKGGTCPLCGGACADTPDHIAERVKALVGG